MKKILILGMLVLLATSMFFASAAASNKDSFGPAPNSGDCIPDGSGLDRPDTPGFGPAPNSGDCIPDGSGF